MKSCKAMLALAAMTLFTLVPQAHAWIFKDFRKWSVSCSNGLTCSVAFTDSSLKSFNTVEFRRSGAPNANIELLISLADLDTKGQRDGTYVFSVDGRDVTTIPVAGLTEDTRRYVLVYVDQPQLLALLGAMKAGTRMEMRYDGKIGRRILSVDLAGLKASLLFLDDIQQRLGRTDALDQPGGKMPSKDVALKDIKTFDDIPESIRRDFTAEDGACSDMEPDSLQGYDGFDITVNRLRIIAIPCGIGGAYNQPYALYIAIESIERVSFPFMSDGSPTVMTTAYNIDYDPTTGVLTSFFKGRGLGDCGQWYKWSIGAKDGSDVPVLLEQRNKDACGDEEAADASKPDDQYGPEHFPLEWPIKK